MQCFTCGGYGHKAIECSKNPNKSPPKVEKRCFLCDRTGHLARECKLMRDKKNTEKAGAALHYQGHPPPPLQKTTRVWSRVSMVINYYLEMVKTLPFIKSGSVSLVDSTVRKMPVVRGRVGENIVDTLRDTGCSGVVVRRSLVVDEQLTGRVGYMLLIDNTLREVPLAEITVDTPYLRGQVEAQCLPETIYDLIIGNVHGARAPDDPDPTWQEASAVTTRAQAKKSSTLKPLRIPEELRGSAVDRNDLSRLQKEDPSLEKYRSQTDPRKIHDGEVSFEEKNGILFRVFKIFDANGEQATRQVVVPQPLRQQVMNVAHSSILGGHLGVKKTTDKITSNLYWPGIHSDITRFCQSCDICQRTVAKGNVSKVPIEKMPLIDTPFKRVAVDLVGPIYPPSESGHRYILTLVDYATRYPDAVPLKSITTESVAEALVDMYSRLGVPEEVLSDMGAQFVSECIAEVSRPMCNGLVEKFNGTLKCMLKRLCSEQPKQ